MESILRERGVGIALLRLCREGCSWRQPIRTTANTSSNEKRKTRLFAGISERLRTAAVPSHLPYKEGVAGSNPASPTIIELLFCRINAESKKRVGRRFATRNAQEVRLLCKDQLRCAFNSSAAASPAILPRTVAARRPLPLE